MQNLTSQDITQKLSDLPDWDYDSKSDSLSATFKFKSFVQAWGFMSQIALIAEKHNHHPDWSNSYNTVSISLRTHDKDTVTEKDLTLAKAISSIFS